MVVYPRYETGYASSVMKAADAGIKTASDEVDLEGLPVVSMGYSRGGALAVEYAAGAAGRHLPVPDAVESVNPVPIGEQGHIIDLTPLRHSTVMALIVSDKDPATAAPACCCGGSSWRTSLRGRSGSTSPAPTASSSPTTSRRSGQARPPAGPTGLRRTRSSPRFGEAGTAEPVARRGSRARAREATPEPGRTETSSARRRRAAQGRPHQRPRPRRVPPRGHHDTSLAPPARGGRRRRRRCRSCAGPSCRQAAGRPARLQAARISSASPAASCRRAQPERRTASAVAGQPLGVRSRAAQIGCRPSARRGRVAEHGDEPHRAQRRRPRSASSASSVPTTVSTTITAFLPCSFDSPLARVAHVHRHLVDAQPGLVQPQERLHLGRLARVRAARGSAAPSRSRRTCRSSRRGTAGGARPHRAAQEPGAEAARAARLVAVRARSPRPREARADRDVAGARAHALEQAGQLRGRVLPVGVDAPAERVAVLARVARSPRRSRRAGRGSRRTRRTSAPRVAGHLRGSRRSSRRRRRGRRRRGSPARSSSSTAGRFSSSFQAGMKTTRVAPARSQTQPSLRSLDRLHPGPRTAGPGAPGGTTSRRRCLRARAVGRSRTRAV